MAKMRVRRGDKVRVIQGKDKGAEGIVKRAYPAEGRVLVERVALTKKAMRPTQDNPRGGIEEFEQPIDVSNVMLICPSCDKPTRVGVKREDGKVTRICKKCDAEIDK